MFRRSIRLFSEDWLKFFSRDRKAEPDMFRGIKEIGDFPKFIGFLEVMKRQENFYINFNEISTEGIVKVASVYGYLSKQAKKSAKKETKIFNEILEILIFKVEKEKSIEWSTKNITNFFLFLKDQPEQQENFDESTLIEALNEGFSKIDEFFLNDLASFAYCTSILFPEYSENIWNVLEKKFLQQETFNFFTMGCLIQIFSGLFSSKIPENMENLSKTPKFQEFFEELLGKIQKGSLHDLSNSEIFQVVKKLPGEISKELTEVLAEKLYKEITNTRDISDYYRYENILDIMSSIDSLQNDHLKKELFLELNNKVLLGIIMKDDSIVTSNNEYIRSVYLRYFLSISKSLNWFHISLMDQVVMSFYRDINSKFFRTNPGLFSECISSLAFLNYSGRFTAKIPHKETYWTSWQGIIDKTEDFLLSTIGAGQQKDVDQLYQKSSSQKNIDFLWSLCVFNVYPVGILQSLLHPSSIKAEENYEEEDFIKLFQVHYWLLFENNGYFELEPRLLQKMNNFKEKADNENKKMNNDSGFKNVVRESLIRNNVEFKENHWDFPYCFDFVAKENKAGILIDDESCFLGGTNMQIRNGFFKVMNRQLVSLGWAVQKVSLMNLMSVNVSELLPK
jgi:hypothetical protein